MTNLGPFEESCASLETAGKIRSVRSLVPDNKRAALIFSTKVLKCWAVHFLTTAFK